MLDDQDESRCIVVNGLIVKEYRSNYDEALADYDKAIEEDTNYSRVEIQRKIVLEKKTAQTSNCCLPSS